MSTSKQTFFRAYPAGIERTGPRELTGRLVPYDVATDVLDVLEDGSLDIYREGFRRGAFAPQATARGKGVINKIGLVHTHGPHGLGYLGPFQMLREEADGLYGSVRILPSVEADVEALLESGVDELSVEFRLPRSDHTVEVNGIRWRTRAHLDQVALEPKGAYSRAQVLAYRAEVDERQREEAEAAEQAEQERQAQEAAQAEEAERERLRQEAEEAQRRHLEAEAEAAAQRRAQFDALAARYDSVAARQQELVRQYGITQPPR